MKKVLVTGGGGFLGRYIVAKLLENGSRVKILGRQTYPDLAAVDGIELIQGDISDKEIVSDAVSGTDTVFHVAAYASIWGKWDDFYNINVVGTRNVIDACLEHGVKKLIYTSSPSVVYNGEDQLELDETAPYPDKYLAFYPETKAIAEQEVLKVNGKNRLHTVSLRPHLIWGPGDTNLIPRLLSRASRGKLRIVGDQTNMIDTVYVENAADAHLQAAEKLEEGSTVCGNAYFITQGEPVNCWYWINHLLKGFGLKPVDRAIPFKKAWRAGAILEFIYKTLGIRSEPRMTRFLASQLAKSHTYSIEKARRDFGYSPKISMAEGMARLFSYKK